MSEVETLTLVNKMLSAEWAGRFESPAGRDADVLRAFDDLCWDMASKRFFRGGQRAHFGAGGFSTDGLDAERLKVAALRVRRAALGGKGDRERHERVIETLRRLACGPSRAETLAWLLEVERRFEDAKRKPAMGLIERRLSDPEGRMPRRPWDPVEDPYLSAVDLLDNWLHARVAHSNPEREKFMAFWRDE